MINKYLNNLKYVLYKVVSVTHGECEDFQNILTRYMRKSSGVTNSINDDLSKPKKKKKRFNKYI